MLSAILNHWVILIVVLSVFAVVWDIKNEFKKAKENDYGNVD